MLLAVALVLVSGGKLLRATAAFDRKSEANESASLSGTSEPSDTAAAASEKEPALHPILKLAPEPMKPSLASILRKRVPGVHVVRG